VQGKVVPGFASGFLHRTELSCQCVKLVGKRQSGANQAALKLMNKERQVPIEIRQVKYLNNIVEQDHRAIKRITRPMLGFKSFRAARAILAGIELMHMIRKGQFMLAGEGMSFADQFYALAGQLRPA
jgi:putative transposase